MMATSFLSPDSERPRVTSPEPLVARPSGGKWIGEHEADGHRRRRSIPRASLDSLTSSSSKADGGSLSDVAFALPASTLANEDPTAAPVHRTAPPSLPINARYVTVSSVLSRSGAALPPAEHGKQRDPSGPSQRRTEQCQYAPHTKPRRRSSSKASPGPSAPRSSAGSFTQERAAKRASNGSALEALGALFLRRDSSGKVSNLSFMRHTQGTTPRDPSDVADSKPAKRRDSRSVFTHGLTSVSRAWLEGVAGATRVGIAMPRSHDVGQTIAQRRARKTQLEGEESAGRRTVGTRDKEPTFEVAIDNPVYPSSRPQATLSPAKAQTPPPAPRLAGMQEGEMTPPPLDFAGDDDDDDDDTYAKDMPRSSAPASGVYGPGSAFSWIEPLELPPSPVGMPGEWALGSGRWGKERLTEEGALLLPPPLLDDQGSDAKSFEGLLGVRRMRERERARKQMEKLKARNRPAHKVGMLTAFGNFVRAAHAADKATRAVASSATRPAHLQRRHTEPSATMTVDDAPVVTISSKDVPPEASDMRRSGSLKRVSMDSSGRQLDTVYEARAAEMAEDDGDDGNSTDEGDDGIHSETSSSASSVRRHRHRVPVRVSSTDDDEIDHLSSLNNSLLHSPRQHASRGSGGPITPRIGPTMLSLPPSPWTPYGGGATTAGSNSAGLRSGQQTPFHVQLGMTPVFGPPGTPRLIPSLLEVAPSPFSTLDGSAPYLRSPSRAHTSLPSPTSAAATFNGGSAAPSPLALSPVGSPQQGPVSMAAAVRPTDMRRRRTTQAVMTAHDPRLTPSGSMQMMDNAEDLATPTKKRPTVRAAVPPSPISASPPVKRSFLLWFLFGDLGLGTRSTIAAKASGSPAPTAAMRYSQAYNFTLAFAAHTYGFSVFVLAHLVDLGYRIAESLAMTFWFFRWFLLNVTGQTVLARCAIDAYQIVAREWETVSREDHERKGRKTRDGKQLDIDDGKTMEYRGLSRWQVLKGLIELFCLQDVTRERYLHEGAGLEELKGWRRQHSGANNGARQAGQIDLGAMRMAARNAMDAKACKQAEEASDSESSEDDDDDDMVVTRRGPEILEFTKTPKVEGMHGYFSSSGDSDDAPLHVRPGRDAKRSLSFASTGRQEPANRQMVKLIKWASRLAISAYGLHVTLVDLPATFTPSGNRFSRQTFAHLSRLHHEDVLHADIQTLDADDYSPTFYLVRDLTRRVVAVSVRGTQSLQDIIVDLEMVVDQVKLHNEDLERVPDEALFCHAGVLRAAQALIAPDSTLFRTLSQALQEHPDFGIVFTGHSLGGAIASTVVLLLSRFEEAEAAQASRFCETDEGRWVTHDRSGLPAGRSIRAITFAHPATVSANLAARAARGGTTPLVLSVVLGHDIIPRCGHGQARELRRVLGALSRVRRRRGPTRSSGISTADGRRRSSLSSIDGADTTHSDAGLSVAGEEDAEADEEEDEDARVHVVRSWWRWRSIKRKGELANRTEQLRAQRIEDELWRLRCDVENDLYSAVKRRTDEARRQADSTAADEAGARPLVSDAHAAIPPSPWMGPAQRAKAPLHQLTARRQALDAVTLANEESISKAAGVLVPAGRSIWLYEGRLYDITSPLSFYSVIDLHPRMFSEHFPSAYEDWLEKL